MKERIEKRNKERNISPLSMTEGRVVFQPQTTLAERIRKAYGVKAPVI